MARLRRNVCWYWGTADPVGRGTPAVSCKNGDPIVPQNRHRPHEYALSWRFGLFQALGRPAFQNGVRTRFRGSQHQTSAEPLGSAI